MNNKLPKVDYSKIMLDIERDSKRLGNDSSDDSNIKDESSNIENDDDDRNDQSSEDDHQNYEYSEEEQSISDTDTYRDEDGESEEVFEKISAEEDQVVKKDKEEYFKKDSIPKWIEDLFPEDLINALNDDFTRPKNRGRTTSINADNVNDLAYYIEKRKKGFKDPLKGTKDVTPFHYSGKNYKFKCHTYISRNRLYKKAVYSPFKKKHTSTKLV